MEKMETLVDVPSQPGINGKLGKIIRMISFLTVLTAGISGCTTDDTKYDKSFAKSKAKAISTDGMASCCEGQLAYAQDPLTKICVAILHHAFPRDSTTIAYPVPCTEKVLKRIKENE